jgi:ribosomal protein S18 acetylase RimI-like enzyme
VHIKLESPQRDSEKHAFIRLATLEDAEHLHHLDLSLADEVDIDIPMDSVGSPADYTRSILRSMSSSRTAIFLVAEVDGQVVGSLKCTGYRQRAFRHVATLDIAIHKDFRSQGIGTALMQEAVSWAKSIGFIKRIELFVYSSNEVAIALYKKFGFEVEGLRKKGLCHRGAYVDYYMMALLLF